MKCNQSRPGFELVSPYPFPTMITITQRAFDKSMKHWYNGRFCSLHFSWNCRALKIISTVPRLARKPHCDSGRIPLTIVRTNLFKSILENNFPTIDSRDLPLKLLQSDFKPFLYKDTSIASLQSWGTSLSPYTLDDLLQEINHFLTAIL